MQLKGSCHCAKVKFTVESGEPVPFMRCYCSICRKTAGRWHANKGLASPPEHG
jgi:hypothetical protein